MRHVGYSEWKLIMRQVSKALEDLQRTFDKVELYSQTQDTKISVIGSWKNNEIFQLQVRCQDMRSQGELKKPVVKPNECNLSLSEISHKEAQKDEVINSPVACR